MTWSSSWDRPVTDPSTADSSGCPGRTAVPAWLSPVAATVSARHTYHGASNPTGKG